MNTKLKHGTKEPLSSFKSEESTNYIKIPSKLDSFIDQVLSGESKSLIFNLTNALGSPLHIIFPEIINKNINDFKAVLNDSGINYQILYAHKANKSRAVIEVCAKNHIGVDVASVEELCQALGHGVSGNKISVSGPIKNKKLLCLAYDHNCLIQIDSIEELELLKSIKIKGEHAQSARILLRVSHNQNKVSRFGINNNEINTYLNYLHKHLKYFNLEGFSFHLSGYSLEERAKAILGSIELIEIARNKGFLCNIIDIGGGIPISYTNEDRWHKFQVADSSNLFHAKKQFSNFYPYYSFPTGAIFLQHLLEWRLDADSEDIAELLKKKSITLLIEPGRSLLDQGGITIFKVRGAKSKEDYEIVTVDGMSFSLSEQWFNSEFLPDPIHLQNNSNLLLSKIKCCVVGASCLDSDVISWRKIVFDSCPQADDLLVYINTAGYQMDSNESEFHLLPLPQKVVFYNEQQKIKWKLDKEFHRLDMEQ